MGEELIDGEVAHAPGEMCCSSRLLSRSCRTGDGIDGDVVDEESGLGHWQQAELDASGEATRVGEVKTSGYVSLVDFRKSVDIVVAALDAEILGKVYYLDMSRYGMLFEEGFALAVAEAEEYDIDVAEGHV